ncbi:MAG: type II secretion system F family protein [Halothermotrichaceae bacterium]
MAPLYDYEARSRGGDVISGSLEADEPKEIVKQLKKKGYYVTDIKEKYERKDVNELLNIKKSVKTRDLVVFSQQFSAMIDAGIPLIDALNIIREQTDHQTLKETLGMVVEDVETGTDLSEAFMQHPKVFPPLYCQMIRAGESGGVLDQVLLEITEHYERQDEINSKVKSALYYPITIMIVAVIVVLVLLVKVVPTFVDMFSSLGGELPLPTRILLGTSNFLQNYWYILIAVIALGGLLFYNYKKTPTGEYNIDKIMLKFPIIGKMMKKVYISRIASTLSTLLDSGVDLLASLTIVEDVVGNEVFARILTDARSEIREGVPFSRPLADHELFPSMVIQMIRVGEETGSMEEMLDKLSNFYEQEVERSIDSSISLIEPIMIAGMAVVVGFIVISVILPMFEIYSQL